MMLRARSLPCSLVLLLACASDPGGDGGSSDASSGAGTGPASTSADGSGSGDATAATTTGAGVTSDATATSGSSGGTVGDSSDGSSDGSSGDTGAVACAAVLCEDFEQGALDEMVWTRIETDDGNTVTVQSDVVAGGSYALQFHAVGGTSLAMMFTEAVPEPLRQHAFGRVMFRATDFPFENGGHSAYVLGGNGLDGFPWADHHLEVGSYYDGPGPIWQLTYWTGDGPEYIGAGGHIPQDEWFCLEWEFNDEPNQIRVWVDGSEADGAAFDDIQGQSDLLGEIASLGLGFRTWHPMGAPDIYVYMDDLVLDTQRVGCPG
ncbi:MAG: hypothetical protein IPN32_20670 [Deltaproteobacteria bacterium]|nr:hypothetical protein [Deltaproteobacteria bacterium]